jgi:hypothetical protein
VAKGGFEMPKQIKNPNNFKISFSASLEIQAARIAANSLISNISSALVLAAKLFVIFAALG